MDDQELFKLVRQTPPEELMTDLDQALGRLGEDIVDGDVDARFGQALTRLAD